MGELDIADSGVSRGQIVDPKNIVRDDGTHLAIFRRPPLLSELKEMAKIMCNVRYIILIIPMFCCEMALGLMSSVNGQSLELPIHNNSSNTKS